jgi:diguanylate cyclase (GGDEF)-like protein/PAS domain S-box-containing protein
MISRLTGRGGFERAIFQEHPSAMWVYDPRTLRFLDVNDAAVALYGYSRAEFLESTIDRLALIEEIAGHAANGFVRHRTKTGSTIRVQVSSRTIPFRATTATLAVAHEIGDLLDARDRLRASESSLALVQQLAHVGTFTFDNRTGERFWSDEVYRILGMEPGTAPFLEGFWAFSDPADADRLRSEVLRARSERRAYSVDHRILRADGTVRTVNESGQWQYDERGEWCFLSGTLQDITERERAQREIRHLAYHDPLTNLLNRAGLVAQMEGELSGDKPERLTAVIFFDIDRFKTINDTLGHRAGDDVLLAIAERLKKRLGNREILARTGGDEFVAVVPNCADRLNISLRAEQLLQAFRTPFIVGNYPYTISASVGISIAPLDGTKPGDLLRSADIAMYQSKTHGKNRYNYYTEHLQSVAARRFDLERGLRRGLDQNEFVMHYQPIVSAGDGGVKSVEALLRWHNRELQPTPPGDFVEFAEETGLIEEIGDWVFETTFAQAKQWADDGTGLRIWVNVSAVQLHAGLPSKIRGLLDKHQVNPDWIGFELTESSFINADAETLAIIQEIKSLGFRLALDDFGVKYSSLEYLQRLPIDTVKIDRVFVTGVSANRVNRAIIQAIVNIAHEMHLRVSAEGIETAEELATIKLLGCDSWQGYFFSPARAPQELRGFVDSVQEAV